MPVALKRVDGPYIIHEIQHVLHFEKGILYTIKALLLQPGQNIRTFLTENRSRLVKPILFIVVTSLLYTSITHFFHIERQYAASGRLAHSATMAIMSWIESNYGYANIIMGVFIGLWLKLLCRKSGYNFFEILIMLCFVMGIGMLLFAVFALIEGVTRVDLLKVAGTVTFIYCLWAIGQFFDGKKGASYLFAFIAYLLGMVSFTMTAILTGFLIDLFNNS
ncbi:DUF3667 domain-containing protein [Paraflavitalea devenefica]|uniref:DUF3667 domain-containing protein n=1 Tax=Paraflavitalea devenefica TaxID=2716334 RepID=UPI001FE5C65C|nr:DUF3667 domain-containing protein [Paraflavitalea devenefica]